MTIVRVSKKGRVTLPKAVREHLQLKEGDPVQFEIRSDGTVILHRASESGYAARGTLHAFAPKKPVSVEEMDQAIGEEVTRQLRTST